MKKLYIILVVSICCVQSFAQNTSSPYSIIGIGDIEKSYHDKTSGLGHSGVALTSNSNMLLSNPASLSFLQNPLYQNAFYFDLAAQYKNVNYSGTPISSTTTNQSNDLQFKKIAFAIKPKANWGLSFGLLPFSNANYSFNSLKKVQGSNVTIDANYEGNGSTNLLYLSNSFLIAKKFSIGLQSSLLFGHLLNKEVLYSAITDSVLSTEKNIFLSKIFFKGGLIYKDTINKNWNFSVGATGSLKNSMAANYQVTVKDGNTILKSTEEQIKDYTSLPVMYTVGLALHYTPNYTFVVDYSRQNWSSLNVRGLNYTLSNSNKIGLGFQYTHIPAANEAKGEYFYQVGYYNNDSYLNVFGQNINEWAFTFGAGKQLFRKGLSIQGTIEIGSRGTAQYGLIKENISQIGITISYKDFWNTKRIKRYN